LRGERWARSVEDEKPEDDVPKEETSTTEPQKDEASTTKLPDEDTIMTLATVDYSNVPSSEYPRPTGCSEYEALGGSERSQYCSDVLLPEALIQLQALRDGLREGEIPNPDDAKEHSIYETASQKLTMAEPAGAWVDRIITVRQQRLSMRQPIGGSKSNGHAQEPQESPLKGSTRSRRGYK